MWPLTEGRRIEKRRHVVPLDDRLSIELDLYAGQLAGLITGEIEFASEEQAERYQPPTWLDVEVTGEARYSKVRWQAGDHRAQLWLNGGTVVITEPRTSKALPGPQPRSRRRSG